MEVRGVHRSTSTGEGSKSEAGELQVYNILPAYSFDFTCMQADAAFRLSAAVATISSTLCTFLSKIVERTTLVGAHISFAGLTSWRLQVIQPSKL